MYKHGGQFLTSFHLETTLNPSLIVFLLQLSTHTFIIQITLLLKDPLYINCPLMYEDVLLILL